eukprot:1970857-Pleurochrysis_carterae.AAC.2
MGFSAGVGVVVALVCIPLYAKVKKVVEAEFDVNATKNAAGDEEKNIPMADEEKVAASDTTASESGVGKWANKLWDDTKRHATQGMNVNIHDAIQEDTEVQALHDHAEKFDPKAEAVFRYIQVFTAICDSFAHGANDVANAMGPFMAIY